MQVQKFAGLISDFVHVYKPFHQQRALETTDINEHPHVYIYMCVCIYMYYIYVCVDTPFISLLASCEPWLGILAEHYSN